MFGPARKPALPKAAMAGRNKDNAVARPKEDGPAIWRRSIYLFTKRSLPTPLLDVFDAPNPNASCGRRGHSTVATQALALLNDPFIRTQAEQLARRVTAEAGGDTEKLVRRAFLLTLCRPPTAAESDQSLMFLARPDVAGKTGQPLADLCHVLLTLNEFAYID
jgi:hypothetical protein